MTGLSINRYPRVYIMTNDDDRLHSAISSIYQLSLWSWLDGWGWAALVPIHYISGTQKAVEAKLWRFLLFDFMTLSIVNLSVYGRFNRIVGALGLYNKELIRGPAQYCQSLDLGLLTNKKVRQQNTMTGSFAVVTLCMFQLIVTIHLLVKLLEASRTQGHKYLAIKNTQYIHNFNISTYLSHTWGIFISI